MRYNYNNSPGANAYGELEISEDYSVASPPDHIDLASQTFVISRALFATLEVKELG